MALDLPSPTSPLKIGTRGSPLALAQAYETRARLMAAFDLPEEAFEIVVIKTTGDAILDRPLKEIGGKGLFTREIEDDMLSHAIDIAVHSMKDMPVEQPAGLLLDTYLPREDVRDAFVSPTAKGIAELAEGETVGTSSLRRRAQSAERAYLAQLEGSCETPIAGLAELDGNTINFRAEILRPDGTEALSDAETCAIEDGPEMGRAVADRLTARAPKDFFDWRN